MKVTRDQGLSEGAAESHETEICCEVSFQGRISEKNKKIYLTRFGEPISETRRSLEIVLFAVYCTEFPKSLFSDY
jgi:hypothetical protein